MIIVATSMEWDWTTTGYFCGIPCRIAEEYHAVLDRQGKTTLEFVNSKEFQMLQKAGIEVHGGNYR